MSSYKKFFMFVFIFLMGLTRVFAVSNDATPIGYWKTIDDVTGKPKSIIQIWKTSDHILMGKVIHIYPKPGEDQTKRCDACQGALHNQPVVGMVILSGLKSETKQWGHGRILDPENGKTYSCSLRVSENGAKLNVHGYIGIPLFGRSQTWERVDQMTG
ncbi:MAG: DUF2147 domain-containing protein [Gammaproteobacteria bacterium]|nr:DUF2147 domain-containing protein [Gammaproteobacteria bacterium]